MTPPAWTDWLTASLFRIRVAPAASEKLGQLTAAVQQRLKQMLQDIAELADLVPPSTARGWSGNDPGSLLHLHVGRVSVRYSINEESRTLTIEHVIVPEDEALDSTG
jgi:mRNA-degrading endonuclease RelE of RelBE toxin-antitoxin system